MTHLIAYIVALVLIVPGIAMAFVPMLPALPYMFVAALGFAFFDKFTALTGTELATLFALVAISFIVDHTSGALGAKYGGAHTKSLLWGILGGIIGTFFFPALGSFVGLFVAILAAELYYRKTRSEALKAAGGALIGSVVGVIANVLLALVFVGLFAYFALA